MLNLSYFQSPVLDVDGAVSKERHDTVCRDLSMQIAKNLEMEMRLEHGYIQRSMISLSVSVSSCRICYYDTTRRRIRFPRISEPFVCEWAL